MSRDQVDGIAHVTGVSLKISAGEVGPVRQHINEWCEETHTKAIAWCLYIFRDEPRMSASDICEWLDEIGVRTPVPRSHGTWLELLNTKKDRTEQRISTARAFLRDKSLPFNR